MASTVSIAEKPSAAAPPAQPLVVVCVAAAAGIVLEHCVRLPLWTCWAAVVAGLGVWAVCRYRALDAAGAVCVLLAVAALGAAWHHLCWRQFSADEIGLIANRTAQPAAVELIARQTPRRLPPQPPNPMRGFAPEALWQIEADVAAIRDKATWRSCAGRVRLVIAGDPGDVQPGDRLRVFATLTAPLPPRNPGEFDFAEHARGSRRLAALRADFAASLTRLDQGSLLRPMRWIEWVRAFCRTRLDAMLPDERQPLANAMLLGQREEMDEELNQAFLVTGTIHVLSVSGLHVSVLAGGLGFLLLRLPLRRWLRAALMAAAMLGYALLVDAQPPVVRATILVLAPVMAYLVGRQASSFNALAGAALVVLVINPADLFRTGPQLSFLCVVGLLATVSLWQAKPPADPLQRLIENTEPRPRRALRRFLRGAWSLAVAGALVWGLTLPLVLARFHVASFSAVVVNVLISLPVALAMYCGVGTLLLGWVPGLGWLLSMCSAFGFGLVERIVGQTARVPGGHLWAPGPSDWWLAVFYSGLALLAAFPALRPPCRWCLALLGLWTAVGFAAAWQDRRHDDLRCTFVAIGHGCAVLVESPAGHNVLYDAGRLGAPDGAARTIAAVLWSKGIMRLDAVVVSHANSDHYNALPELLSKFAVGAVYVSPTMFENDRVLWDSDEAAWQAENAALAALRAAIDRAGVPVKVVRAGDRLAAGAECRLDVLHPPRRGLLGSDNANSLVIAVEHAGRRVLLPGDLEKGGLVDLLAEEPLDCDVLMAPHHGSRQSNPTGLADWCMPEVVVISGSHRYDTTALEGEYRAHGCAVYHTADTGAVEVRLGRTTPAVISTVTEQ